jgi:hypothetical protein
VIKGLVESHGIEVKIVPKSSGSILKSPGLFTNANIPYELYVPEESKDQAERLIDDKDK